MQDTPDPNAIILNASTIRMAHSVMLECRKAGAPIYHTWNAPTLCKVIAISLKMQQVEPLFDIEDILNAMLTERLMNGNTRNPKSFVSWFLEREGNHVSYAGHNARRQEIPGEIPEDDEDEQDPHDMRMIACPSPEAGSDMHIAIMDVREHLGDKYADLMECKLAGASRESIFAEREPGAEPNFDTIKKTKTATEKVIDFLRSGGYHLDTANRRLGSNSPVGQRETFFPADTSKGEVVHNVNEDVDHRCHYEGKPFRADYDVSYSRDSEHSVTPLNGELVTKYVSGQVPKVTCPKYGEIVRIEITNQTANQYLTRCGMKGMTLVAPGFQEDTRKGLDTLSKNS